MKPNLKKLKKQRRINAKKRAYDMNNGEFAGLDISKIESAFPDIKDRLLYIDSLLNGVFAI